MPRVCVIDVAGLSCRLLGNDRRLWINSVPASPRPMQATFPVVAASVQASMTTGAEPGEHGVIAGGIFRRQCRAFSLSERSNTLLNKKRFWHARRLPRLPKVSLVFWSNPLAGAADVVIGAATYEPASDLVADLPVGLYSRLAKQLGPFDASLVRGPGASWRAGEWIVSAAETLWREQSPDLQWVYLPGISFETARHGTEAIPVLDALRQIDALARRLAETVEQAGGVTLIVSDGGAVDVKGAAYPNVALRRAGLLRVKETATGEVLDLESSRAFALVDHQIAHLFCTDEEAAEAADAVIAAEPNVAAVRHRDELFCLGLGHDRAGERVVLARPDAWLCYRWWEDDSAAPALAYRADTPGKSGYDPCELFAGKEPGTIDIDPARVRASRGLATATPQDQCVLAGSCPLAVPDSLRVTDLPEIVSGLLFR